MRALETIFSKTQDQTEGPQSRGRSAKSPRKPKRAIEQARDEHVQRSTVEAFEAEIERLRDERRAVLELRNQALLPKPGDPSLALNREAAKRHDNRLREIDNELSQYEGAIEAAKADERHLRRQELEYDHAERLARLTKALDRREKAAHALDNAAAAFVQAYKALLLETETVQRAMLRNDSAHPSTSGAGVPSTLNAVRERLRGMGVAWAAPQPIVYQAQSHAIAERVQAMNASVLAAQPKTLEEDHDG